MDMTRISPGPVAEQAFRLGVVAGAVVGLTAVGVLYWQGILSVLVTGYVLVFLFPVYLVVVATILSVWLGFDKDVTSLRPVSKSDTSDNSL